MYSEKGAIHEALWDDTEKEGIKIEGLDKPVNDIEEKNIS